MKCKLGWRPKIQFGVEVKKWILMIGRIRHRLGVLNMKNFRFFMTIWYFNCTATKTWDQHSNHVTTTSCLKFDHIHQKHVILGTSIVVLCGMIPTWFMSEGHRLRQYLVGITICWYSMKEISRHPIKLVAQKLQLGVWPKIRLPTG